MPAAGREVGDTDRGAVTVLVVGLCGVVLALIGALLLLGQAAAAQARATTGADLTALAAADTARGLRDGEPCRVAGAIAVANRVRMEVCRITAERGGTAQIVVTAPMPYPWPAATGRARAGAPP
ncbi:Rv3654c family TadE-like protein [Tersicoccus phoenicis]|uniref:Rv3654c family TadE-like protein n=1 Tax=Tersicoccus phoenicis TaxID=554083 RepID=UPI00135635A4|nr:Rv3654c family TadE-like protein [Tersicoccus phoenicis]